MFGFPEIEQESLYERFLTNLADNLDPNAVDESPLWTPNDGPQTDGYETLADELFYGGAAGGGKCVSDDHNVLTLDQGWIPINHVKVHQWVLSSDACGQPAWHPVTATLREKHTGRMLDYDSPYISFRVTPTHKVPILEQGRMGYVEAQHLENGMLLISPHGYMPFNDRYLSSTAFDDWVYCITVMPNHTFLVSHRGKYHLTGNTDLLLGWAVTRARLSIIYRREYGQFKNMLARSRKILTGTGASYSGQPNWMWTNIPGDRVIEFASVQYDDSVTKYMGRPHDFIGFDEVSNFLESQYLFLTGWNRTEIPGQRTRIIAAGNPPTNTEGEWVIRRWAPWIDPGHVDFPAPPGQLRWFARIDDEDIEVEGPARFKHKDEIVIPRSRTFIPARLSDNPYYGDEYRAVLQGMPEPLRSKLLYGDFSIILQDDPWQVIPSAWIRAARERFDALRREDKLKDFDNVSPAYGLDVAEAGKDFSVLCKITGNVVQWTEYTKESDTMQLVNWVLPFLVTRNAPIGIDANGVGAGVFHRIRQLNYQAVGIKVSTKSPNRDRTGVLQFLNLRSYLWWLARDALDPEGSIHLALPPDEKLLRELASARWSQNASGLIQVESKESIRERLGRSPDASDALMMAMFVRFASPVPLRMV